MAGIAEKLIQKGEKLINFSEKLRKKLQKKIAENCMNYGKNADINVPSPRTPPLVEHLGPELPIFYPH